MKASIVNPGQVLMKDLRARNDSKGKNGTTMRPLYTSVRGQTRECDKPELKDLFEQWLVYATEKIKNESDKQQVIKSQLLAAKDEIKSQGVIVSGLLRERHSVHITPDDSALVLSLRETIEDMKKREASMSRQIERLRTRLADRKRPSYTTFPNSQRSTSNQSQSSSKHTASTNSLSPSDRLSYQSNPTSSSSIRSANERSQDYESESEQKRLSQQSAKKHQLQEQTQVTQVLRKQLKAERQLILALEEAVTDLEAHVKELLSECQHWKQKSAQLQTKVDECKDRHNAPVDTIGYASCTGITPALIHSATLTDVRFASRAIKLKRLVGAPDTDNTDIAGTKDRLFCSVRVGGRDTAKPNSQLVDSLGDRERTSASVVIVRAVNDEFIVRIQCCDSSNATFRLHNLKSQAHDAIAGLEKSAAQFQATNSPQHMRTITTLRSRIATLKAETQRKIAFIEAGMDDRIHMSEDAKPLHTYSVPIQNPSQSLEEPEDLDLVYKFRTIPKGTTGDNSHDQEDVMMVDDDHLDKAIRSTTTEVAIQPGGPGESCSQGDSGSALFDSEGGIVGLFFIRHAINGSFDKGFGYATPIELVFQDTKELS
ncbi:kinesin [Fusarium napiforme]|uniref:Kinesin n=1 Tax=Fusarium napiforme TaxID=42672 RepID=A0A8H5JFY2_9HYPO|nr:kinesin [Fusarium napiforme]